MAKGKTLNLPQSGSKEQYRFSVSVGPGEEDELILRVPQNGTVEGGNLRIYAGAELALQVDPYIVRKPDSRENLIQYIGKKYIDGDDDNYPIQVSKPVFVDDYIRVWYKNTSAEYTYDFSLFLVIDYLGGPVRVVP